MPTPIVRRGAIASGYNAGIGVGDPVSMLSDGTIALTAAGSSVSFIFAGWQSEDQNVWRGGPNWVAGTTWTVPPIVHLWDIETNLFKVQADGAVAITARGENYDHVAGTINTRSGHSGAYLGIASIAGAGNSAGWKVDDILEIQGNAWGDTYTEVVVFANERNVGRIPGNAI